MMTVSRVLNGRAGVALDTRARVERAISVLGFTPNGAARELAISKAPEVSFRPPPKIAFLFDGPNAIFLGAMVDAGFREATSAQAQLVFTKARYKDNPSRVVRSLLDEGTEGVILSPPLADHARLRQHLAEAGLRVLAVGCCDEDPTISTVGIDDRHAAFELTRHLIQLGHRRIGFILGHPRHKSSDARRQGFETALLAHGIAPDRGLQWEGGYNFGAALDAVEKALDARPPITALFASNDDMAAAAISVARGRGIDVPGTLTVCGFDDSELALMVGPSLTTICQPVAKMVQYGIRQLARELHALRNQEQPKIKKVLLRHALILRESDAPPGPAYEVRRQSDLYPLE
jgi:LacI family transcriptional regulator